MATLKWDGTRLMLGTLALGEVREAGMMAGNFATYWVAGGMPVAVSSEGRFKETNAKARTLCAEEVEKALEAAGVEVDL
jgi:hypothetical protein